MRFAFETKSLIFNKVIGENGRVDLSQDEKHALTKFEISYFTNEDYENIFKKDFVLFVDKGTKLTYMIPKVDFIGICKTFLETLDDDFDEINFSDVSE